MKENDEELQDKLTGVFQELEEKEKGKGKEKLLVFIFDDFEWNLEPEENKYKIMPEPAKVLKAVVEAIENSETPHKIIITCRYDNFDTEILSSFYSQGLEAFSDSDLQKKLRKLEKFNSDNISEALIERALNLADGNPRLLEFLNDDILGQEDVEAELKKLEQSPEEWKDKIIWKELYQLIDEPLQQVLSYCLVYELRVPMVALEAVCDSLPNYEQQLQRGLDLGLIETSPEPKEEDRVYRVSRILPHIIPHIRLPAAPDVYSLYQKAHDKLYELWGNGENRSEQKWREIFRLLFADTRTKKRFRQGFSKMLAVQYNPVADEALESELRQLKDELPEENFYDNLGQYLSQGKWREADEETAWLFYLVMVQQGHKDWKQLCMEIPIGFLNEMDKLWVEFSRDRFGFSIQKSIFCEQTQNPATDRNVKQFGEKVGWCVSGQWIKYETMFLNKNQVRGNLPALCLRRPFKIEAWQGSFQDVPGWKYLGRGNYWSLLWGRGDIACKA